MNIAVKPPLVSRHEIDAVNQPLHMARGMPNQAYTDQACFEFEREHVFANQWAAIGFAASVETASVKPVDFMGLPLLVSRDRSGETRVFHNVCSHRGMKLVSEQKKTNGLVVCPYHSWTYALDGQLKATPHIGGVGIHQVDGFSCADHGLREVPCHIWLGILFVNLDGKAESFDKPASTVIARYRKLMGETGESLLRAAVSDGTMEISLNCNWKLAIENYLEAYHLPFIHPSLNSYSPLSAHRNEVISGNSAGQITSTFDPQLNQGSPLPLFPDWDEEQRATGEYPVLYPNLMLGFQANHLFALVIHPLTASTCREELMIFYVGDESADAQYASGRQTNLNAWAGVFAEDIGPCELMQTGRQSPGYVGGAFSPVHDTCSHHFHKWIAGKYAEAQQI